MKRENECGLVRQRHSPINGKMRFELWRANERVKCADQGGDFGALMMS